MATTRAIFMKPMAIVIIATSALIMIFSNQAGLEGSSTFMTVIASTGYSGLDFGDPNCQQIGEPGCPNPPPPPPD